MDKQENENSGLLVWNKGWKFLNILLGAVLVIFHGIEKIKLGKQFRTY